MRTFIITVLVFLLFLGLLYLVSEWGAGELAEQTERYIELNS